MQNLTKPFVSVRHRHGDKTAAFNNLGWKEVIISHNSTLETTLSQFNHDTEVIYFCRICIIQKCKTNINKRISGNSGTKKARGN